jgi:glycosyltransferase involved in cell wall biosynthesis
MPVFNGERYLARAVASILGQTFTDFELVVVDDGSTDRSLAILQRISRRDPRLRIISRPNTGISGARNDGTEAARGDLVASMDADDLAYPQRLADQVAYMTGHENCTVLGASVRLIDPDGVPLDCEHPPLDHQTIVAQFLRGRSDMIRQPVAMLRRPAILAVGGYRSEYSATEDLDLFLKLAERGQAANLPQTLLDYRQHLASTNRTRWADQCRHREAIVAEAHRRRGMPIPTQPLEPYNLLPPGEDLLRWGWAALAARRHVLALRRSWQAIRRGGDKRKALRLARCALHVPPLPIFKWIAPRPRA